MLSQRLEKLFPRDPHAGPEGSYQVVSLYYDDPYDTALRQKLDGVNRREKFRLRYYGEEPAFFKLEKKYKVKGLCGKGACRLSREEGERAAAGGFRLPPGKGGVPGPGVLRPSCAGGWPPKRWCAIPGRPFSTPRGMCGSPWDGDIRAGAPERFLIPQKAAACPGGLGRGGSEIRRLFAGDCKAGGAGPQPAGDGLLQVRPVPPL